MMISVVETTASTPSKYPVSLIFNHSPKRFHTLYKNKCMRYNICTRQVQRLGGGRGCNIFVPVLGGNGTKIAPTGDILDEPPGQIR